MNHTTNERDGRHQARFVARAAGAVAVAVAVGFGPAACGDGDEQLDSAAAGVTSTGTAAPQTPATGAPAADDPNGGGSGTGNGGNGTSGDDGNGDGEPSGRPPRILNTDVDPYISDGAPMVDVLGHAYDDDGPDPQLQVERVEVQWGDGTTTPAELSGSNVFRAHHEYDSSYLGQMVTVQIVAHSHGGQTASEAIPADLSS